MSDGAEFQTGLTPEISAALAGTDGSPSGLNKYVTDSDPRLTAAADVAAEVTRAEAAEGVLQDNIDAEASTRASADTTIAASVTAEASARTAADALKADIASPTFTGNPQAPTPSPGDDDTSIATTAFVQDAISGVSSDPAMGGDLSGTASNAQIVAGAVGATEVASSLKPSGGAAAGTEALRALGTSASTAAAGNDSRLSDARTPTTHHTSHESGGSDAIKLDDLATPDDNTDLNATSGHHGLLPKLSGSSGDVLKGDGSWGAAASGDPTMGGDLSGTASNAQIVADAVGSAEIAAGAVGASEIASALKPSGSAATTDEALRALGTTAGTAAAGNDSRLSDSRAPSGSAGGDLTGTYPNPTVAADKITLAKLAAAVKPSGSAAAGDEAVRALGTGANNACAGNDSRLSDARTPTDGSVTAAKVAASLKPSGSAATTDEALRALGTATGTAAAGDDSRITGAAQKASNLSDLGSASTARSNLGLGGAAVLNVGTSAGTVAAGDDSRFFPEEIVSVGMSSSVVSTADSADFYKAMPYNCTLKRMKVTCKGVNTAMVVQLRKSTDGGSTWSDVSGFTVTFASGDKHKEVDPSNVDLSENDMLGLSCTTVSGQNLLCDVVMIPR